MSFDLLLITFQISSDTQEYWSSDLVYIAFFLPPRHTAHYSRSLTTSVLSGLASCLYDTHIFVSAMAYLIRNCMWTKPVAASSSLLLIPISFVPPIFISFGIAIIFLGRSKCNYNTSLYTVISYMRLHVIQEKRKKVFWLLVQTIASFIDRSSIFSFEVKWYFNLPFPNVRSEI